MSNAFAEILQVYGIYYSSWINRLVNIIDNKPWFKRKKEKEYLSDMFCQILNSFHKKLTLYFKLFVYFPKKWSKYSASKNLSK
jgi:hypothetical protein